jgi:hypothetical protein
MHASGIHFGSIKRREGLIPVGTQGKTGGKAPESTGKFEAAKLKQVFTNNGGE